MATATAFWGFQDQRVPISTLSTKYVEVAVMNIDVPPAPLYVIFGKVTIQNQDSTADQTYDVQLTAGDGTLNIDRSVVRIQPGLSVSVVVMGRASGDDVKSGIVYINVGGYNGVATNAYVITIEVDTTRRF